MNEQSWKTQGKGERVPWVFLIDQVDSDVYALSEPGGVSLVDGATLKQFLVQIIGGWYGQLGGDDVGRA